MFPKVGPIISAKISLVPVLKNQLNPITGSILTVADETQPCTSDGYGFVVFENEDDAKKVIGSTQFAPIEVLEFTPKDPEDRKFRCVFIKNFDEKWDVNNLSEIFGKYGKIKTIYIREDP